MKKSFTVAGVEFHTRTMMAGYGQYMQDQTSGNLRGDPAKDGMFPATGDSLLHRHNDLKTRFDALVKRSTLQPEEISGYLVSDYKMPIAHYTDKRYVLIDRTLMRLLTPDELDGIVAHELAHLEMKHKPGIRPQDEFAADKRAAEITGKPEALASALHKLDKLIVETRRASGLYNVVEGMMRVGTAIFSSLSGQGTGLHPHSYIREGRLMKFADQVRASQRDDQPTGHKTL